MTQPKFKLGAKLKDIVTGIEGIATARVEYLTGCTQYGIQRLQGSDGLTTTYLDETRWQEIEGAGITLDVPKGAEGGPADHAPSAINGLRA